jgi:hypothetical protein
MLGLGLVSYLKAILRLLFFYTLILPAPAFSARLEIDQHVTGKFEAELG